MDDLSEYRKIIEETQGFITELNSKLATVNTISSLWAGANLQITELYRSIAENTNKLEGFFQ